MWRYKKFLKALSEIKQLIMKLDTQVPGIDWKFDVDEEEKNAIIYYHGNHFSIDKLNSIFKELGYNTQGTCVFIPCTELEATIGTLRIKGIIK